MNSWEVAIIGAGPAGIACAIQLKRHGIDPLLVEKGEVGGLLKNANLVENYLGFPKGISGVELVRLLKEQLKIQRVKIYSAEVSKLDILKNHFILHTTKDTLEAKIVVVASGTEPKRLENIKVTKDIEGHLFYEVYPLRGQKGKKIAILGAGDAAFDYALNLSQHNQVVLLNRKDTCKCLPLLFKRMQQVKNISYLEKVSLKEITKEEKGLLLKYEQNAEEGGVKADFLLAAIGRKPDDSFLSKRVKKNLSQLQNSGKIYMIGDVVNGLYRQVSIAASEGIKTAMGIYQNNFS